MRQVNIFKVILEIELQYRLARGDKGKRRVKNDSQGLACVVGWMVRVGMKSGKVVQYWENWRCGLKLYSHH